MQLNEGLRMNSEMKGKQPSELLCVPDANQEFVSLHDAWEEAPAIRWAENSVGRASWNGLVEQFFAENGSKPC
jgi:hypothetical protein